MNINDLLEECRLKDVFGISAIEYVILENSGRLSIKLNNNNAQVTLKDLRIINNIKGISLSLIVDGKVIKDNLNIINKYIEWLEKELLKQDDISIKDVLYAYLNEHNEVCIQYKNIEYKNLPIL